MGQIPQQILEQIEQRLDIAEFISGYIPLKRAGRNFKALCPFHQEKTPSFMVNPEKNIFHCFGCGVGGNIFHFLMKQENIEFPEAVKILAKKANVALPSSHFAEREKESFSQQIFRLNELAAQFYEKMLRHEKAITAREYLKRRQLLPETVIQFRLGYAPQGRTQLLEFLTGKGYSASLLDKAGLVFKRESGQYADRFWQRVIFPIFDLRNQILGFGGRILADGDPKYVNSPENAVYQKGRHLFGLNFAKEEIKAKNFAIIVEGYLDLISPFQFGLRNLVATLGTALTVEQVRTLKRYSHNVVMLYDGDQAGEQATLRSLDLLLEEEMNVKVSVLPSGYDPDSFVHKAGPERFVKKVLEADDLFDYKLKLLKSRFNINTIEGKLAIAKEVLPTLHRVANSIRLGEYVKRLGQEFHRGQGALGEEWILAELKKIKRYANKYEYEPSAPNFTQNKKINLAEQMLLAAICEDSAYLRRVKEELKADDFPTQSARRAVEAIFDLEAFGKEEITAQKIINRFQDDGETCQMLSEVFAQAETFTKSEQAISDCIHWLKRERAKRELEKLQTKIKLAQAEENEKELTILVRQYNQLIKEVKR
jgi:DNA primase